ncbi:MAG: alkaline phosphatase family protein [Candidatus Krumholzibacteria bacterium]|nr:alkaline phosphatase family protein [Candidatus Krumholzibacteria bacterium]
MNKPGRRPTHAIVFGISGATWDVAAPLLAAGRLPHLQRLVADGCSATMLSVRVAGDRHYRPQVGWVTAATGCLPEHHGVTTFYQTADDCRRVTVWDAFQAHGRRVGLFAWPLTWPPKPLDGFVIPCYHARNDTTWPPELASVKRIERQQHEARQGREASGSLGRREWVDLSLHLWRNGIRPSAIPALGACAGRLLLARDPASRALALRHGKLEVSAAMFLHLYKRWRPHLGTFHSFLVDNVSHRYWRYRDPARFGERVSPMQGRLASAVDDAYVRTDRVLGRLLRVAPRDAMIAVVSEHGMAPEPSSNEVGEWQYMIRGPRLSALIGLATELVDTPIARWISYRSPPGKSLPSDAVSRFRQVRVVETGLPLFNVYEHGSDEIIVKFSISKQVPRYLAGDLDALHVEYNGRRLPFCEIARRAGRQRSAMHDQRGILVLSGPDIRPGVKLPDCSLTDFAPTLLAAVGLPAPGPFDGRILDVFG